MLDIKNQHFDILMLLRWWYLGRWIERQEKIVNEDIRDNLGIPSIDNKIQKKNPLDSLVTYI